MKEEIIKYFKFLEKKIGFIGPYEWNIAYEKEYTYIKNNIFLNISYDGAFIISVGKTKKFFPDLLNGKITLNKINYKERESYLLNDFLPPKQKNEYKSLQSIDDQLNFWAEIVKANNEVLYGDFTKFSIRRRVINYFWGVSKIVKYFTK